MNMKLLFAVWGALLLWGLVEGFEIARPVPVETIPKGESLFYLHHFNSSSHRWNGTWGHFFPPANRSRHHQVPWRSYNALLWGHALATSQHNLVIGYVSQGDWLVKTTPVKKSSSAWPWSKVSGDFNFTLANDGKFSAISCVQAMDLATDGKGAYATLTSGGPGYRNVTLRFKSERGGSINFMVYVYARTY